MPANVSVYKPQGGASQVVGSGGQIDVQSGGQLDVESGGAVNIESGGDVAVASGGTITLANGGAIALGGTVTATITAGDVILSGVPTSDPGVTGALWANSNVLTLSA